MSGALPYASRLLFDEDLSPKVAHVLREEDGIDAIGVRDRGLLSATDHQVLELAFEEDRILVTANVRDFERLAAAREIHGGIVLVLDGGLLRAEQLRVVRRVLTLLAEEAREGRDLVNRVLRISLDGTELFESMPS